MSAEHIVKNYDFVIMDCLTGNRSGPMSQHSGLLYNSNKNEAIDYILTNAVLASTDSIALDIVAAVLDLSRVELWINNKLIVYRNEGDVSQGRFIFNVRREQLPENTYIDMIIAVWDKNFNSIQSTETFFKS